MTKDRKPPSTPARIEWALGFLSAAAVLAIAGYLGFEAAGSDTLPDLKAEILPAAPEDGPGQLRFVVRNDGGQTATAVTLALVLRDAGGAPAGDRRLTVDYLPGHSEATGGFVVGEGLEAELVVEGYLDP